MRQTINKLMTSAVFGFAFFCLCVHPAKAQQEVPKVELGPLFTLNTDFDQTDWGVGGRVTFNLRESVGLEAEVSLYPAFEGEAFGFRAEGDFLTALFGLKVTRRLRNRLAVFGKVRPGFARGTFDFTSGGGSFSGSATEFVLDYGGGVEVFASKRVGWRTDIGLITIRSGGTSLLFSTGVTFRF